MQDVTGTIIFDLDGTLVDSVPDLAGSLDTLMAEKGLEPIGIPLARKLIGHGIPNLVRSALKARDIHHADGQGDDDIKRFIDIYSARVCQESKPYPNVATTLKTLADAGWRMGVCTNKVEALAKSVVAQSGLETYFSVIAGPDTFGIAKPDPRHLLETAAAVGGHSPVIFIGDSEVDVETAKAAGIPVIAMTYGYSKTPLETLAPEALIDQFSDIPDAVDRILSNAAPSSST